MEATNKALERIDVKQYPIPVSKRERILELLQIILENNEFTFNKKMYRQKTDVPMGTC